MIDLFSIVYKDVNYPLPTNYIKTISAGNYSKENKCLFRDDTSTNISNLNRYFSELTAHYWVYKNFKLSKYIGFCHYRRYFNLVPNEFFHISKIRFECNAQTIGIVDSEEQMNRAIELLSIYDVILTRKYILTENIKTQYCNSHPKSTWDCFIESICVNAPKLLVDNIKYFDYSFDFYFYPIFIMRTDIFCDFMENLFNVLIPVYAQIGDIKDEEGLRFQNCRYPAYLAERFMMLYFFSNKLKLYGTQLLVTEDNC
jgi:hypothetical protein